MHIAPCLEDKLHILQEGVKQMLQNQHSSDPAMGERHGILTCYSSDFNSRQSWINDLVRAIFPFRGGLNLKKAMKEWLLDGTHSALVVMLEKAFFSPLVKLR